MKKSFIILFLLLPLTIFAQQAPNNSIGIYYQNKLMGSMPLGEYKLLVNSAKLYHEELLAENNKRIKIVVKEKPAEIKIVEEPKKKEVKSSWSVLPSGKVKMDEIKRVKTMGPVDELKYMDLTNFHRLAEDPIEAFEKIAQKLKVLENIDYGKMLEGVKAWRQNPINKLYLNIFAQAGNEGKSVSQIIAERKAAGKEYLSQEEINGLLKFNKKISF
jgi:hypothetical protein